MDSPEGYTQLMAMLEAKQAVVLPAFEPRDGDENLEGGKALALKAVASDKGFVAEEYK